MFYRRFFCLISLILLFFLLSPRGLWADASFPRKNKKNAFLTSHLNISRNSLLFQDDYVTTHRNMRNIVIAKNRNTSAKRGGFRFRALRPADGFISSINPLTLRGMFTGLVKEARVNNIKACTGCTYFRSPKLYLKPGLNKILIEAESRKGEKMSEIINITFVEPPKTVDDIVSALSSNMSKLSDFTATATSETVMNSNKVGGTVYMKYFFKAPDKVRMELFSDEQREILQEVVVSNGENIVCKDMDSGKVRIASLKDTSLNSNFENMNLFYISDDFIRAHEIETIKLNLKRMKIIIKAIPKEKNSVYDYLQLTIDYFKGIVEKLERVKNNRIIQSLEVVENKMFGDSVCIPAKLSKVIYFPNISKKLSSAFMLEDIELNQGLSDSLFILSTDDSQ